MTITGSFGDLAEAFDKFVDETLREHARELAEQFAREQQPSARAAAPASTDDDVLPGEYMPSIMDEVQRPEQAATAEPLVGFVPVASSVIRGIQYDDEKRRMTVQFCHGGTYTYYRVPKRLFRCFRNASSKGHFFNSYVKGHYGP